MRILLTGACGVLGQAVRRVAGADHEFSYMDQAPAIAELGGRQTSITDFDAVLEAAEGCDAIIHTAAMHGGSYGKVENADYIKTNVLGANNIYEAALQLGIRRVVMSSSMEVLCGKTWDSYGTALLHESLPPRPDWIYPLTKLQVEELGSFYSRMHGLEVVQLRYMYLRDEPIDLLGLNLLARQFTAEDAAQANLLAATLPGLRDEVIHIGPDTLLNQKDINEAQVDPWGVLDRHWPGCIRYLKDAGLEPKPNHFWPAAPIDKAKLVLGWYPQSSFTSFLNHLGWTGGSTHQ